VAVDAPHRVLVPLLHLLAVVLGVAHQVLHPTQQPHPAPPSWSFAATVLVVEGIDSDNASSSLLNHRLPHRHTAQLRDREGPLLPEVLPVRIRLACRVQQRRAASARSV